MTSGRRSGSRSRGRLGKSASPKRRHRTGSGARWSSGAKGTPTGRAGGARGRRRSAATRRARVERGGSRAGNRRAATADRTWAAPPETPGTTENPIPICRITAVDISCRSFLRPRSDKVVAMIIGRIEVEAVRQRHPVCRAVGGGGGRPRRWARRRRAGCPSGRGRRQIPILWITPVYVSMLSKAHMMRVNGDPVAGHAAGRPRQSRARHPARPADTPGHGARARCQSETPGYRPLSRIGPCFQTKDAPNRATSAVSAPRKARVKPKSGPENAANVQTSPGSRWIVPMVGMEGGRAFPPPYLPRG